MNKILIILSAILITIFMVVDSPQQAESMDGYPAELISTDGPDVYRIYDVDVGVVCYLTEAWQHRSSSSIFCVPITKLPSEGYKFLRQPIKP